LIDTRTWWVLANYRESKLKHIHPGTHVEVYKRSFSRIVSLQITLAGAKRGNAKATSICSTITEQKMCNETYD
jgi:multidrug resistance efflux pump